ncbi:hypothetical protein H5410_061712 [Solanum commersonii]|uniref:Putative plant transposon protein domain-containing protein n=1 Tax=Solanum commersonii TaxID=4109 RepID=A0A9J5W8S7_SOLCO|nr:hypothetical protein H5410_061712 [Solanum commersonii]
MARDPGTYREKIVREFYASYAATLHGTISKKSNPLAQDPLMSTMVREFYYKWDIVRSGAFQRNAEQREAIILWLAKYIIDDGERAKVSPTKTDNQLTWDRAVMVATLVAGVEIDFARMLLAEIHERAFKTSTTYPFPCLILQMCRDFGVPIWHCDREPQVEVPPLGIDPADTVGQAQGGDPIIPDHSNTIPASSSQDPSMAPSSS